MTKKEIEIELRKCTNLVELIGQANKLKRQGEKETSVNAVVTKIRREMLKAGSPIKRIKRIAVPVYNGQVQGILPFSVDALNKPLIVHDGTNILL